MTKKNARTVGTRLSLKELAKARDGLLQKGIKPADMPTASQILRLCVFYMILNCPEPKNPPTVASEEFIKQLWKQTKMTKNITLNELVED